MVLPSIGTIFTGAAATGVGVVVATDDQQGTSTSELLRKAANSAGPGDNHDDDSGNPPPYRAVPQEYRLTPQAILAVVKSWDIGRYNPPGTNCTSWLRKIHSLCEQYNVPISQRALCAMHRMRVDCKEAAHTAGCYDMTWDGYTAWLHQYNSKLDILISISTSC